MDGRDRELVNRMRQEIGIYLFILLFSSLPFSFVQILFLLFSLLICFHYSLFSVLFRLQFCDIFFSLMYSLLSVNYFRILVYFSSLNPLFSFLYLIFYYLILAFFISHDYFSRTTQPKFTLSADHFTNDLLIITQYSGELPRKNAVKKKFDRIRRPECAKRH